MGWVPVRWSGYPLGHPDPRPSLCMHRHGWTALHWSARHGHLPNVRALINACASLNIPNEYSRWPFWGGRHGRWVRVGVGQCHRRCRRFPQVHAAAHCCLPWPRRRNGRAARRRRGRVHRGPLRVRCAAPHRTGRPAPAAAAVGARRKTAERLAQENGNSGAYAAAVEQARGRSARHRRPHAGCAHCRALISHFSARRGIARRDCTIGRALLHPRVHL
jgi:hypothetical protein